MIETQVQTLIDAPITPDLPIKVLIHGYKGHRDLEPNPQIRPNYVSIGYNVISVDYGIVARKPCYSQAVDAVPIVGRCVGEFIAMLMKYNKNVKEKWLHIITFSLGCHIGVEAGKTLSHRNIMLPRLTVLDAAAPLFYLEGSFTQMNCSSFIDAVHTNAGLYGKSGRTGHVDFYVNYLLFQRGCTVFNNSCNHLRAAIYFGESITSTVGFWGYPLESRAHLELMGEYTPPTASGSYYLSTNEVSPYATGDAFPKPMKNFLKQVVYIFVLFFRIAIAIFSSPIYQYY